jgi:pyridoxine 5-phosphate synthase
MHRRKLGVNIDHVATLRQARGTLYPQPATAARLAELAGADQITVHLREDRRHIQDDDLKLLRRTVETVLNLEMAATPAMVQVAQATKPCLVTLVPEKRQELTTEGGLDVAGRSADIAACVAQLKSSGIPTSLFIDADTAQVHAAHKSCAQSIELHTGSYCDATTAPTRAHELQRLIDAAHLAESLGLQVACGHGLHYHNVKALVPIAAIEEYNIGHSIVAQAVFVGLERAVRDMLALLTP